jgi:pimeloyl-ACP methyl ester carboxylesterase
MPFVEARGVQVHYAAYGASREWAERTVLVLHGYTLDHRSSEAVFEPAFHGRDGWRRLYLDFPGMGRTRAPAWVASSDDVLEVTAAAVAELVDGPYALAGVSFGGYVAAGLTAAAPDRVTGLALVVPMVKDRPGRDLGSFAVLHRDPDVVTTPELDTMAVVQTAQIVRRVRTEIDTAAELADEDVVARIDARYQGSFPLSPPGGFDRPALVLVGRQDDVLGYADQWAEFGRWPRCTYAVLDRAGHLLPLEQVALTNALVDDWLDRVEQPVPPV